jgi:hypothetical protein
VPYVASADAGAVGPGQWLEGANCQVFAYDVLSLFGLSCPPLHSSNLWEDRAATVVERPEPLDLVLFNATADPRVCTRYEKRRRIRRPDPRLELVHQIPAKSAAIPRPAPERDRHDEN